MRATAIIVVAVFCCAGSPSASLERTQRSEQENAREGDQEATTDPDRSTSSLTAGRPAQQSDPNPQQGSANEQASYWEQAFAPDLLSNWVLAAFGVGGLILALVTLMKIAQQANAATVAAIAAKISAEAVKTAERASIGVVAMRLDEPAANDPGAPWLITIGLTNFGHTTAHVDTATITLKRAKRLPPEPVYGANQSSSCPPILAAGEQSNWRVEVQNFDIESEPVDVPVMVIEQPYWVYGRLVFTDTFGGQHEYGFGREWRPTDPTLFHKEDRATRFGYPEWRSYNYARELSQPKKNG